MKFQKHIVCLFDPGCHARTGGNLAFHQNRGGVAFIEKAVKLFIRYSKAAWPRQIQITSEAGDYFPPITKEILVVAKGARNKARILL